MGGGEVGGERGEIVGGEWGRQWEVAFYSQSDRKIKIPRTKPPFANISSTWSLFSHTGFIGCVNLFRIRQQTESGVKTVALTPVSWRGSWVCAVITVKAACWSRPLVDTKLGDVATLTSLTQYPGEQGGKTGKKTLSRWKSVKGAWEDISPEGEWIHSRFLNGSLCERRSAFSPGR